MRASHPCKHIIIEIFMQTKKMSDVVQSLLEAYSTSFRHGQDVRELLTGVQDISDSRDLEGLIPDTTSSQVQLHKLNKAVSPDVI